MGSQVVAMTYANVAVIDGSKSFRHISNAKTPVFATRYRCNVPRTCKPESGPECEACEHVAEKRQKKSRIPNRNEN